MHTIVGVPQSQYLAMGILSDAATGALLAEGWAPAKGQSEVYWTPGKKGC
jgi:hypothetical protein